MPFHPTVLPILGNSPAAIQALNQLVPGQLRSKPPLALPLSPSSSLTIPLPLLLGRIHPRRDGSLVISHAERKYSSIVFAPPLSVQYRSAIIYCQDYRHNGLVIEVMACHVHILLRAEASILPHPNVFDSLTGISSEYKLTEMKGTVFSKSPIFGRNEHMAFVLELSVPSACSMDTISVLFQSGKGLKWWPFLQIDSLLGFTHLKRAELREYDNRTVFKDTDDTYVFSLPLDSNFPSLQNQPRSSLASKKRGASASPVRKRPRVSLKPDGILYQQGQERLKVAELPPFFCSEDTITYEGVISECLDDGRLILDGTVYLHLSGDVSWLSSGMKSRTSMRKGAKIQALFVRIGYQRGIPTTLFPTGRTTINFLYFGQTNYSGSSTGKEWSKSPWFRYWQYLSKYHALWVQELYDTLPFKFEMWTGNDVEQLLGNAEEGGGLLEFLIGKVAGVKFKYDKPPRKFYDEFFARYNENGGDGEGKGVNYFPYMPTISDLTDAIEVKWESSRGAVLAGVDKSGRVFVEEFGRKEVANAISTASRKSAPTRRRLGTGVGVGMSLEDVIIVGLLEGCSTIDVSFVLTDSTGAIYCECIGNTLLDPIYLGAVVIVREFTVSVESTNDGNRKTRNTLLFEPKSIQILIDGPYNDKNFKDTDVRSPTQIGYTQSQFTQHEDSLSMENLPLAFILINQVSRITWDNNSPLFRITGKFLGAAYNRYSTHWEKLSSAKDGENFIDCFMVIQGKNSVLIRDCLQEGTVFAISCSDFKDVDDIRELCVHRENNSATNPPSIALYSTGELWIKKLDPDDVGRFSVNPSKLLGLQFLDLLQALNPENGESGLPVSFRAIFLYGEKIMEEDEFKESENEWRRVNYRIVVLDIRSALFRSEILFFHNNASPRALIPGKSIRIVNVKRRLTKNRSDGTDAVLFTACEMTRIYMDESSENTTISLCCHRPYPPIEECCQPLSLWDFLSENGNRHLKGVIRVNILEVVYIDFSLRSMNECCDACRSNDGNCIHATAYVLVDDGTTQGEIQINSFPKVMQLLDGSEDDCEEFRTNLPDQNILRRLTRRLTCKSLCIYVRNRFASDQRSFVEEATLHGHSLGYGRKLWTAEAPKLHMARLEALAIYPENDWEQFSSVNNRHIAD